MAIRNTAKRRNYTGFLLSVSLLAAIFSCGIGKKQMESPLSQQSELSQSKVLKITYFQKDERYEYLISLLSLILEATRESYGEYELVPIDGDVTQARGLKLLEDGLLDIAYIPTSISREERFLPVKIPLLKGILGYRVFIIHKNSREAFEKIDTLEQLRGKYRAGFGSQWADMKILQFNNLKVDGIDEYDSIFKMVQARRLDYFPRGINEAWIEIDSKGNDNPDLIVEETLGLYYPYIKYFFVNKQNTALADRIEQGLIMVKADGSFEKLFDSYHGHLIEKAQLDKRKIFILENPTMSEAAKEIAARWRHEPGE